MRSVNSAKRVDSDGAVLVLPTCCVDFVLPHRPQKKFLYLCLSVVTLNTSTNLFLVESETETNKFMKFVIIKIKKKKQIVFRSHLSLNEIFCCGFKFKHVRISVSIFSLLRKTQKILVIFPALSWCYMKSDNA